MGPRLEVSSTRFEGLFLLRRWPHLDERGSFDRLFDVEILRSVGASTEVAQVNHSTNGERGIVRGMHYQVPPFAETKTVTCVRGRVHDVVVDVRSGSPTFLQWHSQVLEEASGISIVIPPGFAHGFQALADTCELIYVHSQAHHPHAERGLHPEDPTLAIDWPEPITHISERDRSHSMASEGWTGVQL